VASIIYNQCIPKDPGYSGRRPSSPRTLASNGASASLPVILELISLWQTMTDLPSAVISGGLGIEQLRLVGDGVLGLLFNASSVKTSHLHPTAVKKQKAGLPLGIISDFFGIFIGQKNGPSKTLPPAPASIPLVSPDRSLPDGWLRSWRELLHQV